VVYIPSRFRGRARRDAAAFYLSQLARGFLAGELAILVGHDTFALRPADFLVLDIAVSRKGRANHVAVRVRWRDTQACPSLWAQSAAAGTVGPPGRARRVT
jgi:hypothetical protein